MTHVAPAVLDWLTDRWGLTMERVSMASIYEEKLVTTSDEYLLESCEHLDEASAVHQRLLQHSALV